MPVAEDYTETDQLLVENQHLKHEYERLRRANNRLAYYIYALLGLTIAAVTVNMMGLMLGKYTVGF